MSYEPRGKMKTLLDAMRASDRPVWTSVEVAKVLETSTNAVPAFVEPSIRHGVLFRKLENGRSQYSLTPFAPAATVATVAPRETTATGWTPPKMIPPRGEPVTTIAAADLAGLSVVMPITGTAAFVGKAAEPASPAPALADASIPEAALGSVEEEEPTLTWAHWDDGDLDLFGLVELENGGYRIQAKDVARLRRMLAWLPA